MARTDSSLREDRARFPLVWPSLLVLVLSVAMLLVADSRSGPGWPLATDVLTVLVGAQSAVAVGALAVDLWRVRKQRRRDREWVVTNAAATLDLHATLRDRLASLAEDVYRLVRPVLAPQDRVPPELLFADLVRPPAVRGPAGSPAHAAYLDQVRRTQDGPFETARQQAESISLSFGLPANGAEPLDWATARRDRSEARPGDWQRLRQTAVTVEKLVSDLVDPRLADFHARMVRQVAERIEREIADDVNARASLKLAQPEPSVLDERRRRARENPFLRFVRDSRVLTSHVELLVLEASGAAWAVNELDVRDDREEHREPDDHDRRVFGLVADVLAEVRSLHYQLREQTVMVLEIAARQVPAEELQSLTEQVHDPGEEVHYQAMDRLWEFHRERIDKPRRFHRPSTL